MQRTNQGGKGGAQATYNHTARATKPVALLTYGGLGDSTSQRGIEILLGFFALGALAMVPMIFTQLPQARFTAVIPLLFVALMLLAIRSGRRHARQRAALSAQTMLGDSQDSLINAIHRFQVETEVPLRIVLRDNTPTTQPDLIKLFEEFERKGVLDSRGLLFLLSAKTAGYGMAMGPKLAHQKPSMDRLHFTTLKFSSLRFGEGLIDSLEALRPEMRRLFPRNEGVPPSASDSLDIQS